MAASKLVQEGLQQRWTAYPEQAPTTRPDLSQIRLQLDDINTEIMRLLVTTIVVRRPDARFRGEALNRLDGLHRRALSVALRSVAFPAENRDQTEGK